MTAARNGHIGSAKHTDRESKKISSILRWLDDFAHWHEWMPNSDHVQLPYRDAKTVYKFYLEDVEKNKKQAPSESNMHCPCDTSAACSCAHDIHTVATTAEPFVKVSYSYFNKVSKSKRTRVKLRRLLKFSKCEICMMLRTKRDKNRDSYVHKEVQNSWKEHIDHVRSERRYYYMYRDKARNPATFDEVLSLIIDGTEQHAWCLPH